MNAQRRLPMLLLCAVALSLGCTHVGSGALAKLEKRLTFYPLKTPNTWPTPDVGETVWFLVDEGIERRPVLGLKPVKQTLKLHGLYFVPQRKENAPTERPRAVVLYCHGTAGNVDFVAERMQRTADEFNVIVMTFDYRGYGRSEGKPNVEGILADARAARAWLARRAETPERDIVLMGTSLGGGVATALAGHDGCRGLILEDTFTSLRDVADEHAFPGTKPSELMQANLDSETTLKKYHGMLLQRHGYADAIIPFAQGERLHAAAPGPKKFMAIPGGTHNHPPTPEYEGALDEFFKHLPPTAGSPPRLAAGDERK